MTTRILYRLRARSPFHLGERGVGIEEASVILHADTLFSALIITLRELGHNVDALLDAFPQQDGPASLTPPFRLTSAFPYLGTVRLFPRPMIPLPGLKELSDPTQAKALRKVRYVSQRIFEDILQGKSVAAHWTQAKNTLLQNGQVWLAANELQTLQQNYQQALAREAQSNRRQPFAETFDPLTGSFRLWSAETVPRVTVDRRHSRSQVYAAGRVSFVNGGGLFFIVDYRHPDWRAPLEQALRALGQSGIGGERSSGHGQFSLEIEERVSLQSAAGQGGDYVTLSLYWPPRAEVEAGILNGASYSLFNRRGWLASPDGMNLRRKEVRMLGEGAAFKGQPQGALANVTPPFEGDPHQLPHPVWRYGLAFPLACRIPTEGEAA